MKKLIFLILSIFLTVPCWANGFPFLQLGVGARPGGMGLAYTAMSGDALAGYWNPAGLVMIKQNDITLSIHKWIQDVDSYSFSYGWGNNRHGLGMHILYTEIAGIEQRTGPSPEPLSVFSAHDLIFGISYGKRFNKNLSWGITLKCLYKKIWIDDASGFAADFGVQYNIQKIRLGGVVQNIGKTNKLRNESLSLPTTVKVGAAVPVKLLKSNWIVVIDGVHEIGEEFYCHSGVEWAMKDQLALRGGLQVGYEDIRFTGGIGILWKIYRINYSIMPSVNGLGHSYRFSIGINW